MLWRRIGLMVVIRWRKSSRTMKWKLLLLADTIDVVYMGRCSYVVWLHNKYPLSNVVAQLICLWSILLDLLLVSSDMGVERFPSGHGGTVWNGLNMMVNSLFANRHCSIRHIPWGNNRPLEALNCRSDSGKSKQCFRDAGFQFAGGRFIKYSASATISGSLVQQFIWRKRWYTS
jgi:hypothetical protein